MSERRPKILLAPMNMSGMPVTLAKALRARGYEAAHIQYTNGGPNPLRYELDRTVNIRAEGGRIPAQIGALRDALNEGFDIFHFWNRSLVYRTDFAGFSGIDLPLIKARGRRIAYRFTGYDVRLPTKDLAFNPHSPFRYEQPTLYDEDLVLAYHDFLREYVDRFFVQDPELHQFFPEATIIPRALDLEAWSYVGVDPRKARPLVVHAPTNAAAKGTRFVLAAVEALRDEGLAFDFRMLQGMPHAEARQVYRSADIVVDQLLSGATGVTTLEAWALGKCVVSNLRRDLFEPFYGMTDLPVIQGDPETIKNALRQAIQDGDRRLEIGRRGRALVEARHDIAQVIDQYIDAYEDMYATPPSQPTGDGDLRFIALQMERSEAREGLIGSVWRSYMDSYHREMLRIAQKPNGPKSKLGLAFAAYCSASPALLRRDFRFLRDRAKRLLRWRRRVRSNHS